MKLGVLDVAVQLLRHINGKRVVKQGRGFWGGGDWLSTFATESATTLVARDNGTTVPPAWTCRKGGGEGEKAWGGGAAWTGRVGVEQGTCISHMGAHTL